jgi:TonB family protein
VKHIWRALLLVAIGTGGALLAQTDSGSETSKGDVVVIALFDPTYPPLARAARINGDVELKVGIRRDGSIESVVAISGHPMLTQAALNSAQQSRYECRRCSSEVTLYSLTYSFQLGTQSSPGFPCPEGNGIHVTQSLNRVTVVTEPGLVYPHFSNVRARSAKCAYLWQCGNRWGGKDYYYYRVRSAKCLDLWSCGHRLREPFATCQRSHRKILY